MNVERLHAIAVALRDDLRRSGIPAALQALASAYASLATQPGAPNLQTEAVTARENFSQALAESEVDRWPAAWREALDELGLLPILGEELSRAVDAAIVANEVTPAAVSDQLAGLANQLNEMINLLERLIGDFEGLGVVPQQVVNVEA